MVIQNFLDPGPLIDGDLKLVVAKKIPADPVTGYSPAYAFVMLSTGSGEKMGEINLRLGDAPVLNLYAGQIGYNVVPAFRGQRYAARSVRLLLPLAKAHRIDPVWITCNPDNIASRRSCELAGGEFIEIVALPPDNEMYLAGERQKCRYRFRV